MDSVARYDHILKLFADHWNQSVAPCVHVNEAENPPVDPIGDPTDTSYPAIWLSWSYNDGSQGGGTYDDDELDGELVVGIFVEKNSGERRLREVYELLRTMIGEYGDVDGMEFLPPRLDPHPDADLAWHLRPAVWPVKAFDTRPQEVA